MTSYEKDFYRWTNQQVLLLHQKDFKNVDIVHLIEEIKSLGNSERDKLESHLTILFMHLLKIKYQPEKKTRSWDISVKMSIVHANKTLKKNPSLKSKLISLSKDAYETARYAAAQETGLEVETFPEDCPWKLNDILLIKKNIKDRK